MYTPKTGVQAHLCMYVCIFNFSLSLEASQTSKTWQKSVDTYVRTKLCMYARRTTFTDKGNRQRLLKHLKHQWASVSEQPKHESYLPLRTLQSRQRRERITSTVDREALREAIQQGESPLVHPQHVRMPCMCWQLLKPLTRIHWWAAERPSQVGGFLISHGGMLGCWRQLLPWQQQRWPSLNQLSTWKGGGARSGYR